MSGCGDLRSTPRVLAFGLTHMPVIVFGNRASPICLGDQKQMLVLL
jgi:hypothetical protein